MFSHTRITAVLLALLACNTVYYVVAGRTSQAVDSVAWYTLLILFTLESRAGAWLRAPRVLPAVHVVHGTRLIAAAAVGVAAIGYVTEREWLDATNIFLWIAVVVLLEIEVRRPQAVARRRELFIAAATLIYSALAVLILIWLARGKWMDAWDAALWLAAFGVLESDLLRAAKGVEEDV